jgi:hypothetical protein
VLGESTVDERVAAFGPNVLPAAQQSLSVESATLGGAPGSLILGFHVQFTARDPRKCRASVMISEASPSLNGRNEHRFQ